MSGAETARLKGRESTTRCRRAESPQETMTPGSDGSTDELSRRGKRSSALFPLHPVCTHTKGLTNACVAGIEMFNSERAVQDPRIHAELVPAGSRPQDGREANGSGRGQMRGD